VWGQVPAELLVATGWTPPRLQAATDALVAEPPRGMRLQHEASSSCS
jgi:hypothetical protein